MTITQKKTDALLFEHTINRTCQIKPDCLIVPQTAWQGQK